MIKAKDDSLEHVGRIFDRTAWYFTDSMLRCPNRYIIRNPSLAMEQGKFCTGCGTAVEPGMQFCPQCGLVIKGSAADEEMQERYKQIDVAVSYARRNWLIFLLAVYAIPATIAGIIILVNAGATADSIWASDAFQEWIKSKGYNYTVDDIKNFITYAGAMELVSGLCAAASLACVCMRKYWIVAIITCLVASILCFWSIFGMIIGFIVTWMIFDSRDLFIDQHPEREPVQEE